MKLIPEQLRAEAEKRVASLRGSSDAPGFEACVEAEFAMMKDQKIIEGVARAIAMFIDGVEDDWRSYCNEATSAKIAYEKAKKDWYDNEVRAAIKEEFGE